MRRHFSASRSNFAGSTAVAAIGTIRSCHRPPTGRLFDRRDCTEAQRQQILLPAIAKDGTDHL
jgi:hypothetical protein